MKLSSPESESVGNFYSWRCEPCIDDEGKFGAGTFFFSFFFALGGEVLRSNRRLLFPPTYWSAKGACLSTARKFGKNNPLNGHLS